MGDGPLAKKVNKVPWCLEAIALQEMINNYICMIITVENLSIKGFGDCIYLAR